jgi:hypothetical protein
MFSARETPEPREARVAVRLQLPRSLVDRLNRAAEARADILTKPSQARDQIAAQALAAHLQPVATPHFEQRS